MGRSPYGERGLKSVESEFAAEERGSLSLRRAWIEIDCPLTPFYESNGRSPYGERGLK